MQVFITHITEEAQIAAVLKGWIESTFAGQCEVFVSSDLRDIPAGSKWLEEIDKALGSAAALVVLCSPASLQRPWINFEMGCGWVKRVPIIPVCHSGQKKNQLPAPVSTFQALEMDSDSFANDFFGSLAAHLRIQKLPRIDESAMKSELNAAVQAIPQKPSVTVEVAKPETEEGVDETLRLILKAIGELGDKGITSESLAEPIKMAVLKMEYHLERLIDLGLLTGQQEFVDGPLVYRLTKQGRRYLVENGLL